MKSHINEATISSREGRKIVSSMQVLHVHNTNFIEGDDDYPAEGIYVCHAHLTQVRQAWPHPKLIDALIVGPECSIADIVSIREIAAKKAIPLILHTLKYDWKAKEVAIESGVDEYHIGPLDQSLIKRIKLIKHVKALTATNAGRKQLRHQRDGSPYIKFWFLKRTLDIAIS